MSLASALERAYRWALSRVLAVAPAPPRAVTMASTEEGVRVEWIPGARTGRHNLEAEEHVVSVRFADGAGREATEGMWMDVYVGTERSFELKTPGGGDGARLEARVRAENAAGTSAWVLAAGAGARATVGGGDDNWGTQWKKSSSDAKRAAPSGQSV